MRSRLTKASVSLTPGYYVATEERIAAGMMMNGVKERFTNGSDEFACRTGTSGLNLTCTIKGVHLYKVITSGSTCTLKSFPSSSFYPLPAIIEKTPIRPRKSQLLPPHPSWPSFCMLGATTLSLSCPQTPTYLDGPYLADGSCPPSSPHRLLVTPLLAQGPSLMGVDDSPRPAAYSAKPNSCNFSILGPLI